jgi:hypothetical protein
MSGGAKGCLIAFVVIAVMTIVVGRSAIRGHMSEIRSRLTLVVQTPEGERSGTSVSETTIRVPFPWTRPFGFSSVGEVEEEGQAVVVDLGSRGLLFATLVGESQLRRGYTAMYTFNLGLFPQEKFRGDVGSGMWTKHEYAAYLDEVIKRKPKAEMSFKDLPMLVRFRDPNDPASVERVDPLDLAASFGPGVTLGRALVEITDDPTTTGIEARLPWLTHTPFPPVLIPTSPGLYSSSDFSLVELLTYDRFRKRLDLR